MPKAMDPSGVSIAALVGVVAASLLTLPALLGYARPLPQAMVILLLIAGYFYAMPLQWFVPIVATCPRCTDNLGNENWRYLLAWVVLYGPLLFGMIFVPSSVAALAGFLARRLRNLLGN